MQDVAVDWSFAASRCLRRCDTLGAISAMPNAVCRIFLSDEHKKCNEQVQAWYADAGMTTWIDALGNCWGRYEAEDPSAPILMLGSHLDTVVNAGKYDGILGVIAAVEVVDCLHKNNIRLPYHIDICGFADEEGVRYGATLIGSRAVAGTFNEDWLEIVDNENLTMRSALRRFHGHGSDGSDGSDGSGGSTVDDAGLDSSLSNSSLLNPTLLKPGSASRAKDNIFAYLELHIEQGPVLEQQDLPVGIVTSIAGARRFKFTVKGMAGHAGTVPMEMRLDALCISAKIILKIEEVAKRTSVVATVGKLELSPGAVNVIPGECSFTLDIRSGRDGARDIAVNQILEDINEIIEESYLGFTAEEFHNASAVQCSSEIQRCIEVAIEDSNIEPISLVSGAGHDAMAIAAIAPVGMIFVRCYKGISHNPAEAVREEDVAKGLEVFYRAVGNIGSLAGL